MGASTVFAGGLGQNERAILKANDIRVYVGVKVKEPKTIVEDFLNNNLELGGHECDHH